MPGDIKPPSLDLVKVVQDESTDEEPFDTAEPQDIPPLQIVMLIVGTRGDVQPFIAIGKRLQVTFVLWFYKFSIIFLKPNTISNACRLVARTLMA